MQSVLLICPLTAYIELYRESNTFIIISVSLERRRFITRKADPDVPAFMPDVQYDDIPIADDDINRRRGRPSMRVSTSTTKNKLIKANGSHPLGDDEPRGMIFHFTVEEE